MTHVTKSLCETAGSGPHLGPAALLVTLPPLAISASPTAVAICGTANSASPDKRGRLCPYCLGPQLAAALVTAAGRRASPVTVRPRRRAGL